MKKKLRPPQLTGRPVRRAMPEEDSLAAIIIRAVFATIIFIGLVAITYAAILHALSGKPPLP